MRFLIDNNLSPKLSDLLNSSDYNSVHVKEYKLQKASDYQIFLRAYKEKRTIISADTDFGFILSQWKKNFPSVILFRFFSTDANKQFLQLKDILTKHKNELELGSILNN